MSEEVSGGQGEGWGELRSFVHSDARNPYALEARLEALGAQAAEGMAYVRQTWGLADDRDLSDLKAEHAYGVFLEAPLQEFPSGLYGRYEIECWVELEGRFEEAEIERFRDQAPGPVEGLPDAMYTIEAEFTAEQRSQLEQGLREFGEEVSWIDDTELWLSPRAASMFKGLLPGLDPDTVSAQFYELRSSEEGSLLDAVSSLVEDRYHDYESSEPDEEFEQKLEQIEDEELYDLLATYCTGDPDLFLVHASPADLAKREAGIWPVCEIEDQCQQDYMTVVFYFPT